MGNRKKIINSLILCLIFVNVWIFTVPIESENFFNSDNITAIFLRGIGIDKKPETISEPVPILSKDGSNIGSEKAKNIAFKQSQYAIPGEWADTRWKFRKNVTIDATKVSSDLTNFPVLIDLYDTDLQNAAQTSGNDIIFTDISGSILDHEIEQYIRNYNSTHAHLVAWVKVPSLSGTTDTTISMYYGNPTVDNQENSNAVWEEDYVGVWHLSETNGPVLDSTSYNENGTIQGTDVLRGSTGQIDNGYNFGSGNGRVDIGDPVDGHLDIGTNSFTVSFWMKLNSSSDYQYCVFKGATGDGDTGYSFYRRSTTGVGKIAVSDNSLRYKTSDISITDNVWMHIVGVVDRSTDELIAYVNGNPTTPTDISSLGSVDSNIILSFGDGGGEINGTLDEVRLLNVARSSNWIATEYNNQYNPITFYSISSEETYDFHQWDLNSFQFRKNITIDHSKVFQDLTNFPLLVDLYDSSLHDKQRVQPDGDDIIFVDDSGTKLAHEIELFDQIGNGTHAHLVAWVKVPFISNTQYTSLVMYYGNPAVPNQQNPAGVWDSEYLAVHHMEESPTAALYDSTGNDKDLSTRGSMTTSDLVEGQVGDGIDFDNYNDAAVSSNTISFNSFTLSAWIKSDSMGDWDCIINVGDYDGGNVRWFGLEDGDFVIDNLIDSSYFGSTLSTEIWHYLVVTYDGSTLRGYINGSFEDSYSRSWGSVTERFDIGALALDSSHSTFDDFFDGIIDEVRIINTPRSAGWLATEYENQLNPAAFYSISNEEMNEYWWVDGSFDKRRDIVIDHTKVDGNLTDFPIVVKLTERSLRTGNIQPDADDLLFIDSEGNRLAHEIEHFTQNATFGELVVWIKVPKLSSINDTVISMYYGNPVLSNQQNSEIVWDSDYMGVWHLNDDPTGIIYDSTSNNKDGTSGGSMISNNLVSAIIGEGTYFDGLNDYIAFSDPLNTETMTISTWVYLNEVSADWITIAMKCDGSSWFDWQFYARASDAEILANRAVFRTEYPDTSEVGSDIILTTDNWYYISVEHNGTHNLFYLNGTLVDVDLEPDSVSDSNTDMWIGGNEIWGEFLSGIMDEIRVSKIARSKEWINTQYNNQFNPYNFYFIGPQLSRTSDMIIEETVNIGGAEVTQLTTPSITAVENDLYLLSVSMKPYLDITTVTGLGLTWTEIEDQPSGRSQTGISVWYAQGTPVFGGVTVTLAAEAKGLAISLSRISGVNRDDPFGFTETANTNGIDGSGSGGTDSANAAVPFMTIGYDSLVWGAAATRNNIFTPASDYTQIDVISGNTGGDEARVTTFQKVQAIPDFSFNVNGTNAVTDWAIAGIEINPYIIDINPPVIDSYGVDDPGTGTGHFWAKITDKNSEIVSATIEINETEHNLVNNGTHWVYQTPVSYKKNYVYQITNCTDSWRNSLLFPSIEKNYKFDYDSVPPTVQDWEYYDDLGPYGTFKANVSDSWGTIDTVIINVTEAEGVPRNDLWAVTQLTASGYINDTLILPSGTIKFVIIVNDTAGNSFTSAEHQDLVTGTNQAPLVENITLSRSSSAVLLPIYSNDTLYLDYDYYDPDSDPESGTEINWYKNGVLQPAYSNQKSIPDSALIKGDVWNATVRPYDGQTFGDLIVSSSILVQNTPPHATSVVILPSSPVTTSTLSVSYSYSDYDADSQNTGAREICWYKNGILQGAYNDSLSIPSSVINKSEEWFYQLRVHDGTNYSSWITSTLVVISNSAPSATDVQISPGSPQTEDGLTTVYTYSDADNDLQSGSRIRWYKNGVLQGALNDSFTVNSGLTTKGENWYYTVEPSDGTIFGTLKTSSAVNIGNTAPTASDLTIPLNPTSSDDLSANWAYSDIDNDPEGSCIIKWYKNGIAQSAYENDTSIPASATGKGEWWNYTLQVFDGEDYSALYASLSVLISNTPPNVQTPAFTSGTTTSSTDLVASWGYYDYDGDNQQSSLANITWYKNGEYQSTYDNDTVIPAGALLRGDTWNYIIQVYDGTDYSLTSNSTNRVILNSPPTVTNPQFNETSVGTDDDFELDYQYADADSDLEQDALRIVWWFPNGVYNSSFDNVSIIYADNTTTNQFWYYIIRVYDGYAYSKNYTSSAIIIGSVDNTAPWVENLAITPTNPTKNDNLIASYDYDDNEEHPEAGSEIRWYKNGALQPHLNDSKTIPASETTKGEDWYFTIRPKDGLDFGTMENSSIVTIGNLIPEASGLGLPVDPLTTMNLTATWIYYDADGDPQDSHWLIQWYRNDTYQPSYDNLSRIYWHWTNKSDSWYFSLRVYDGTDYSILYNSSITIIQNTLPIATNLQLTENPTTVDTLVASWSYGDVDNDVNQTPLIFWYRNGILLPAFNDSKSIPAANTSKNEFWKYTLRVFDGENYSIVYNSPIRQILNTAPEIVDNLVYINPANPIRGEELEVQYQFTDIDSDIQQGTEIFWYCNGILQTNYLNSLTVSGIEVVKGDQWKVCVRVSDGVTFSAQVNSTLIVVANSNPSVTSASVYNPSGTIYTTNILIADYEATDADGDPIVNYQIEWLNSSSVVDSETYPYFDLTNLDVPANYTKKGQQWTFRIMVFDGEDWSSWTPAFGIIVLNSEPIVENITITGGLTTNETIVLSYDFFDPDGDPDDGTVIDWNIVRRLSGTLDIIHGYELSDACELDYENFAAGDLIWVAITPDDNDGGNTGDMVVSSQLSGANVLILVGNTAPQLNTTLGYPVILADHPDETSLYTAMYSLFVNYSIFVIDVDSGETEAIYDVDRVINTEVLYSTVEMITGTQYRWYRFNPSAGKWELQPGLTSAVVPASALNRDELWKVGVRPRDRYGYYGNWVNSSSFVIIGNTPPQLTDFWWTKQSFTTVDNISFGFDYFDWDSDAMVASQTFILWFKNGELILGTENLTTLSYIHFVKGDEISVLICPYDGTDWAAHNYTNSEFGTLMVIANSAPLASNVTLTPAQPFTTDEIVLTWAFTDFDGDLEDPNWIIEWRRSGVVVPALANQTTVPSDYTKKGETWQAQIWVFDGEAYSYAGYYNVVTVQNSLMEIIEPNFIDIELDTTADHDLIIDWSISDPDNDGQVDYAIYWYCNESGVYVYKTEYGTHSNVISSIDLSKGQTWFCIIQVYDGEEWSNNVTSSIIHIINAAPTVSDTQFVFDTTHSQVEPDIRVDEFYIEDENLIISFSFSDIDNDISHTKIEWFKITNNSIIEMIGFENETIIPASVLIPGEQWFYRITPYDGYTVGESQNSTIISIYSRPICNSHTVVADPSSEGRYLLSVNASDYSFNITEVEYTFVYYDLYSSVLMATRSSATNWTLLFTLDDLSYLNTNVTVVVKCSTRVEDTEFDISSLYTFTLLLEDKAPPRVIDAYFEKNDEMNPTNLTFLALVQEFGSGILEVELFYYFLAVDESGGNGAVLNTITPNHVLMNDIEFNDSTNCYIYAITVDFNHNNSDTDIIYWLSATDNAGNINPTAFDIQDFPRRILEQRFNYTPPGLPEGILIIAGLVIFIIFIGAIVYVKFIRKPELVGLDKEVVLKQASIILDEKIRASLDEHTIGIVISFFDQRHGPIPIVVNPEILKDNFTKLVELSDRSFSGTGFSDDFSIEIPSSYDFVLTQGLRVSVMSFGFALERPDARGGQENITLNILIQGDIFPLVQSFQKEIQRKVHSIHLSMDKNPEDKDQIHLEVSELRKYITSIVLSYVEIYGTTELLENED